MSCEPFDLKCLHCQAWIEDILKIRYVDIMSDASGHIIFQCPTCGKWLESTFVLEQHSLRKYIQ